MLKINDVKMFPNPVETNSNFLVSIEIIVWLQLKINYTWDSLESGFKSWIELRKKAIDMDFSKKNWDEVESGYRTWNSIKRYEVSWDELRGG